MPEHPTLHTPRLTLRRFAPPTGTRCSPFFRTRAPTPFCPVPAAKPGAGAGILRQPPRRPRRGVGIPLRRLPAGGRPAHRLPDLGGDCHDLGYGLRSDCWGRGYAAEAAAALVAQARRDGLPWLTATHDVNNPRSGRVMQKLGMRYCYTYREQWQPKNIPVSFRLYQLNLDGDLRRVCRRYWDASAEHWVESGL